MVAREPMQVYKSIVDSSERWAGFRHRPGDIFVCTPPKVGTTLTQGIVRSLLAGAEEPEGHISHVCPWIDARFEPIEDVLARLDAQTHRRCIKTHTPADGIPLYADAFYIAVYRAGRDSFMSWVNHISNMQEHVLPGLLEEAMADGVDFSEGPPPAHDVHGIFDRWIVAPVQLVHFDTWWPLRNEPNVRILHYDDLRADLEGEMRRLADWLGIDVPAAAWSRVVERCSIDEMRKAESSNPWLQTHFDGGADTFFNKGTNGRWKGVLTDDELARYDEMLRSRLPGPERDWFERGSLAVGARPEEISAER